MSASFDPKAIQDQLRDVLLADPTFANYNNGGPAGTTSIPVISADPGDITTAINAGLQRLGIGVLILTPSLKVKMPNIGVFKYGVTAGPYFDDIRIIAEIIENPTINRPIGSTTYITATTLAFVVAALLHGYAPTGVNERVFVTDVVPVPDPTKTYNMWHVEMKGKAGVSYQMPQIAPVTVSSRSPGAVQLACATLGAPIWYTLDGSYPAPRNPTAQMYIPSTLLGSIQNLSGTIITNLDNTQTLSPLVIAAGQLLQARAWLAGYAPTTPELLKIQY